MTAVYPRIAHTSTDEARLFGLNSAIRVQPDGKSLENPRRESPRSGQCDEPAAITLASAFALATTFLLGPYALSDDAPLTLNLGSHNHRTRNNR